MPAEVKVEISIEVVVEILAKISVKTLIDNTQALYIFSPTN